MAQAEGKGVVGRVIGVYQVAATRSMPWRAQIWAWRYSGRWSG
jgi:hypothetical protein